MGNNFNAKCDRHFNILNWNIIIKKWKNSNLWFDKGTRIAIW